MIAKTRVFMDTNTILESFRTDTWALLRSSYELATVERCVEEALAGDAGDPRRIHVPEAELRAGLAACHPVTTQMLANFAANYTEEAHLDDGELHLYAWL